MRKTLAAVLPSIVSLLFVCALSGCDCAKRCYSVREPPDDAGIASDYIRDLPCLVPMNYFSGDAWDLSVLDRDQARQVFKDKVALPEGRYSLSELSKVLSEKTDREVIWHPSVNESNESINELLSRQLFYIIDSSDDETKYAHAIYSSASLCSILKELCSFATEVGLGVSSSDRYVRANSSVGTGPITYVWCAFLSDRAIVFLKIPSGKF